MLVIYLTLAIIGLIILMKFISWIREYYLTNYNYPVYKMQILLVLFLFCILLLVFFIGLDGSISMDNTIAALAIGLVIWFFVLVYNIRNTSLLAGVFITLYQTIISFLILFVLLYLWFGYSGKRKSNNR